MTAAIQIPTRGRISNPASPQASSPNSRFIIMVCSVSALSVGNISRVPYLISRYGGGAFILAYLGALLLVALPVLITEVMIGRRGRGSPGCYGNIARDEGRTWKWGFCGVAASAAALIVLAAYAEASSAGFLRLTRMTVQSGSWPELGMQGLFLWLIAIFASRDLRWGLRPLHLRLLPIVLILLLGLLIYNWSTAGHPKALLNLAFRADFSQLGWSGVLNAARLALFTVGIGLGMGVSYATVLTDSSPILRVGLLTVGATAGMVLTLGIVGLLSPTAPALQGLLLLAAVGAGVAILYPLVDYASIWTGLPRLQAALLAAAVTWAISAAPEVAGGIAPVGWLQSLGVGVLVPVSALCTVLFAGWAMARRSTRMELGFRPTRLFILWRWLIRYPLPLTLGAMVLFGLRDLIK